MIMYVNNLMLTKSTKCEIRCLIYIGLKKRNLEKVFTLQQISVLAP